jgi:uncharacterized low-complexity protein
MTIAKKPLAAALGAAFLASSIAPLVSAESNPFSAQQLNGGYDLVSHQKDSDSEGKCGEGKCGEKKAAHEGKCGGDKAAGEGSCGDKKAAGEGSCGDKAAGEGSCGGKKEAGEAEGTAQ